MVVNENEIRDWYTLSPAQRFSESQKLWEVFLLFGGSVEPEPDSQSPFNSLYIEDAGPSDGRSGLHPPRGG